MKHQIRPAKPRKARVKNLGRIERTEKKHEWEKDKRMREGKRSGESGRNFFSNENTKQRKPK